MELSPQQDVYYIDTVSPTDYFIDTVTPSAIQLNKEKTMSIELDGPLYLGSNSMQKQVDQNTADITDLRQDVSDIESDIGSLGNLATSDKSSLVNAINETLSVLDPTQTADYIKNSKGLESGEISTNASILPWVEEMSHSTFDDSKFIKVGSPTITSDGMVSNFSYSNGDYVKTASLNISGATDFELLTPYFKLGNFTSGNSQILNWNAYTGTKINIWQPSSSQNVVRMTIVQGVTIVASQKEFSIDLSKWYQVKAVYKNQVWNTYYREVGGTWTPLHENVSDSTGVTIIGERAIGMVDANNYLQNGQLDLKQFLITVDGAPVFSGNITGIDTIKSNDYTVVGSPTINADGIASGFSSSNYIKTDYTTPSSCNSYYECFEFTTDSSMDGTQIIRGTNDGSYKGINLYIQDSTFNGRGSTNGTSWNVTFSNVALTANTRYKVEFIWDGTKYTINLISGGTLVKIFESNNSAFLIQAEIYLGNSAWFSLADPFLGSIDLNSFKIYVNGYFVYRTCLKIPFTLSKTGAKIVDSIYRDRVTDMYEQFGYAPYYTLDTANANYTIPKGEVYGMVNKLVPTLVAPDYSKPVSLTYSSGLVMDNDGWLEVQIQSSEATANPYVSINGSIICRTSVNSNGDLNRDTAMMVVRKGDIITSGGYSADTDVVLTYYPFKV